jgi:general secretion pathway protein L
VARRLVITTTQDPYIFSWCELGSGETGFDASHGTLVDIQQLVGSEAVQLILLAPASDVLVKTIEFSDKERRHVMQTVPYMLEESLITDVEDMHIVMDKPRDNRLTVAAVDIRKIQFWLDLFAEAGLELHQCIPAQCVLLPPDQDWVLHYHEGEYLIRLSPTEVFTTDSNHIRLVMEIATQQFSEMPTRISLSISDDRDREIALGKLPEALQHLATVEHEPIDSLAQARLDSASTWNLLRGKFGRAQQWATLWAEWRGAIIFVSVVLVFQLAMNYGQYVRLDTENLELRKTMESVHREVFPKGQIVDSEKQFRNELRRLQGGGGGSFVMRLSQMGDVLNKASGLEINSITYDEKNGDIRIDMVVDTYEDVEKITSSFDQAGLESELLNSNAQGEQIRARLRVKS